MNTPNEGPRNNGGTICRFIGRIFLLLLIQYGQFDQDTCKQSQINHITKEVELVVSKGDSDLHRRYSNNIDCNDLQVGIFKLTGNETPAYYNRAKEEP